MPKLQNFTKPGHPGYIHRKRSVTQRWISKRERERERERNKMKRQGSSVEIKRENELKRQRETEKGRR